MSTIQTLDGFTATAEVWQMPDDSGTDGNGNEYCNEQWTWGFVPAQGSRYGRVGKGIWSDQQASENAMASATRKYHPGEVFHFGTINIKIEEPTKSIYSGAVLYFVELEIRHDGKWISAGSGNTVSEAELDCLCNMQFKQEPKI